MHITKRHLVTSINVFDEAEQQQGLIEQWVRSTEAVRNGAWLRRDSIAQKHRRYPCYELCPLAIPGGILRFLPEEAWSGLHAVRPERLAHRSPHLRRGLSR